MVDRVHALSITRCPPPSLSLHPHPVKCHIQRNALNKRLSDIEDVASTVGRNFGRVTSDVDASWALLRFLEGEALVRPPSLGGVSRAACRAVLGGPPAASTKSPSPASHPFFTCPPFFAVFPHRAAHHKVAMEANWQPPVPRSRLCPPLYCRFIPFLLPFHFPGPRVECRRRPQK